MGNDSLELQQAGSGELLSKDTIFSTLSNQRRRYVIHYLKQHPEQVRIRDLAEQIAAWENGIEINELTYKQRKRVYTSLHQTHLPKMDDCGIVEYDRDRGHITLTPVSNELDIYLEVVPERELPWSDFYLGLSGAALLLVIVAWADVLPFGGLPPLGYATLIALAFAVAAGTHSFFNRRMQVGNDGEPTEIGNAVASSDDVETKTTNVAAGASSAGDTAVGKSALTATLDENDD